MNNSSYKNLVIEGGGIKGLAFVGALRILEDKNILQNIHRFCGSSAGAIIAMLLALNYSPDEIKKIIYTLDFTNFLDDSPGVFRDIYRVISSFGFYKGNSIEDYFGYLIEKKFNNKNLTFKQLYDKTNNILVVTGSCLNTALVHYYHYQSNPNMQIKKAVRISISIPLFFQAVQWKNDTLVDGGLFNNYPIWFFDNCSYDSLGNIILPNSRKNLIQNTNKSNRNSDTLGLKILDNHEKPGDSHVFHGRLKINSFKDYSSALIKSLFYHIENSYINESYWKRTIPIFIHNINTTDFNISNDKKDYLYYQGINDTINFFSK